MFSCRKATYLMSSRFDRSLSLRERVYLRGHLLTCTYCRRARRQLIWMQSLLHEHRERLRGLPGRVSLSAGARERIRRILEGPS